LEENPAVLRTQRGYLFSSPSAWGSLFDMACTGVSPKKGSNPGHLAAWNWRNERIDNRESAFRLIGVQLRVISITLD
jgi:hypothetical protein